MALLNDASFAVQRLGIRLVQFCEKWFPGMFGRRELVPEFSSYQENEQ